MAIAPFVLLGVAALLLFMPAPRLVISEEITRVTGPLTDDGYIDFFGALELAMMPPELATDENGFRLFVRAFGNVGEATTLSDPEFYRLQKYEKLGLDPNTPPTLVFPSTPLKIIEDYYAATEEEPPWMLPDSPRNSARSWTQSNIGDRPWTLEEYPMLADWVNEIDEPLNAIAEMIRKPIFTPPLYHNSAYAETGKFGSLISILLPEVQAFREIARMFQARAMYRIAQGNIDGAIDDKFTIHRLGRLTAPKGCLVQVLVGIAIEGMATAIPVGVNPEHPLTEQQISRILAGLDALPPRTSLHDAYEWERYCGLSTLQGLAFGELTLRDLMPVYLVSTASAPTPFPSPLFATVGFSPAFICCPAGIDWDSLPDWLLSMCSFDMNVTYRRLNEAYDLLHDAPAVQVDEFVRNLDVNGVKSLYRMWTPAGRGILLADMLTALLLPAVMASEEAVRRIECTENIQRLALAILLYQHEHGTIPTPTPDKNWAVQTEKYLGENPEQYFSCPTTPSPEGMTTYAMVQYSDAIIDESGDTIAGSLGSILLVELKEAVPLDKAVVSVDDVLEWKLTKYGHPGGMNVALRSGAVRFVSLYTDTSKAELRRLLGRE